MIYLFPGPENLNQRFIFNHGGRKLSTIKRNNLKRIGLNQGKMLKISTTSDTRCWVLDIRYFMLDAGYWILDAESVQVLWWLVPDYG